LDPEEYEAAAKRQRALAKKQGTAGSGKFQDIKSLEE